MEGTVVDDLRNGVAHGDQSFATGGEKLSNNFAGGIEVATHFRFGVILPAAASEKIPTFKPREAERINIGRVRYTISISRGGFPDVMPPTGWSGGSRTV
ncbi:MAG: hypothetical protein ACK5Q5_13705 [Planctomycetaceae bacterium]